MFGFLKMKKPAKASEDANFACYGNSPPLQRANLEEAVTVATDEILMGVVERQEVQGQAETLYSGPVPYSTHDLALSVATNFFRRPEYIPPLRDFHIIALLQAIQWFRQGLVTPVLVENFEKIICQSYESDH